MNRFIAFQVPVEGIGQQTALRVRLVDIAAPPAGPGAPPISQFRYVNSFGGVLDCPDSITFGTSYACGQLGCEPEYRDWAADIAGRPLFVTGDAVVPDSTFAVSQIASACGDSPVANGCVDASGELAITTSTWGDHTSSGLGPPDGSANVIDLGAVVDRLKEQPTALPEPVLWMKDQSPNPTGAAITVIDLGLTVDAIKGLRYPANYGVGACPGVTLREWIEVLPRTALLTDVGQTIQLTGKAYDLDGVDLNLPIAWTSLNPAVITIDENGLVTAVADVGSAQIVAEAEGIFSAPVIIVVAEPMAGAIMVTDQQIVGTPTPVDPKAPYTLGYQYTVTLVGTDPIQLDDMLIGTGVKPVGGRVTDVVDNGGSLTVTLEVVALEDLFTQLEFNEEVDLTNAEYEIPADIAAMYDIFYESDGTLVFEPKPGMAREPLQLVSATEFTLGPFKCETSGSDLITLPESPPLNITRELTVNFAYSFLNGGFQKLILQGEIKATAAVAPRLLVGFAGSIKCKGELYKYVLPPPGPLALLFDVFVPIGVGMEINANVTAAQVGFQATMEATGTAQLGVDCTTECQMVHSLSASTDSKFEPLMPSPNDVTEQFAVTAGAEAFAFADLNVANPFVTVLEFNVLNLTVGPKLSLELAHPKVQALDPAKASNFKLDLLGKAVAGGSIAWLKDRLGIQFDELGLNLTIALDHSPTGTFTLTPSTLDPGETATFSTTLHQSTFLGLQVVDEVQHYWYGDDVFEPADDPCGIIPANVGQTVFDCDLEFTEAERGTQRFYSFVKARLFGIPLPFPLEVKPNSLATVQVGQERIAFERYTSFTEDYDIYTMNSDGSSQVNLTNTPSTTEVAPAWSPDGTKIAYLQQFSKEDAGLDVHVMNSDGSNPVNLTNTQFVWEADPAWSPDGTRIAFYAVNLNECCNYDIYTMSATGSGALRLTTDPEWDGSPTWSPDGTRIAFTSFRANPGGEIFVMNADGTGQSRLGDGLEPAWSPDGTKIAFTNINHIYIMNADGTGVTGLVTHASHNGMPAWSSDSTRIAFVSDRDGDYEIYVINADGTDLTRLTYSSASDYAPAWSP